MVLGNSISNTKKLFQRTLEKLKYCLSPGYEKLPKTLNHTSQLSCSLLLDMELEKFKSELDREEDKGRRKSKKKMRNSMVEKKIREMEKLEMSDVDYVLDIEEVIHYYSRLTCPLYLEIIDKFIIQIYSDLFPSPLSPVTTTTIPTHF